MLICLQKLVPQHLVSRIVGWLGNCRCGVLKNWVLQIYIKHYAVDMREALESDYKEYLTFNEFFTRPLKPELRPINSEQNAIVSPVDGAIYELGKIEKNRLLQAKGVYYEVKNLLGGDGALAQEFSNGQFFTAYLSPKDYHRIHMPCSGKLIQMIHVPGKLFSVNPYTVKNVPRLFARNERVVCIFQTELGLMALVAVGAIIVGSIATTWHGVVTPPTGKTIQCWDRSQQNIRLERGQEMGRFLLGSTVILLFPENTTNWLPEFYSGSIIKMGQKIGEVLKPKSNF